MVSIDENEDSKPTKVIFVGKSGVGKTKMRKALQCFPDPSLYSSPGKYVKTLGGSRLDLVLLMEKNTIFGIVRDIPLFLAYKMDITSEGMCSSFSEVEFGKLSTNGNMISCI